MTPLEYFQTLATEHTLVGHSEDHPHFAYTMDDAATLMARRLEYPALFLDAGDLQVTGGPGNELLARSYTLAVVTHVQDSGSTAEVESAFGLTETILTDVLARMVRDKRIGTQPVSRFSPLGAEGHRVELSEAGLYGWVLFFSLTSSLSTLNCNEHFKS